MHSSSTDFSHIPSVDRVLGLHGTRQLIEQHGRHAVAAAVRLLLAQIREGAAGNRLSEETLSEPVIVAELGTRLAGGAQTRLRPVFNLTGTVLHTNLGRALMPEEAIRAVADAMAWPSTLEFDLETGGRGDRDSVVEDLLCELTGAEAASVVNNNAAAVFLLLNSLALRREVVVSRGELIEIGGAFRIPDIMRRAGAKLVEVGTTNRTHLKDYEEAIGARTAILMKVHWSNFSISGFTAAVGEKDLASLAHARELPCVVDLGSGTLVDLSRFGLPKEPTPREAIANGADLVTFSGDKLLGGPQAGILVGRKDLILRIKKNPLKRALRVGKLTLAALEAVLKLYRDPDRLGARLTTLQLLTRSRDDIEAQARRIQPAVMEALQGTATVTVHAMKSQIGSGSLPVDLLPSAGLVIRPLAQRRKSGGVLKRIEEAFRGLPTPVIGFTKDQALQLDLRCLRDEEAFLRQLPALRISG